MSESPLVVWVKDENFKYRYANRAFSELVEVAFSRVLGSDDYAIFPEKVADELRTNDRNVRDNRSSLRTIEDVPGADGILRRWLVQKFPIEQSDGKIWVGGSATNVTEWLSVEESLQDSEASYRRLVEASPLCIHEFDREGRILSMNPAGLAMIGKDSQSEVVGTKWIEIAKEHDRERITHLLQKALAGEKLDYEYESTLGHWMKSIVVPIQDGSDEVNTLLAITEDITDRKRADDQLRASEERHRLVSLATQDPIWEIDLKTGQVTWNERYNRKFGVRPEDTQDSWKWWTNRIHQEDRQRVVSSLQQTLEDTSAERWAEDYRFFDHHGEELYIQDRAFISREEDGSARRIVGTMRDQTQLLRAMQDRAKLLADAQEAQKLESLGVLAGGIAHDFNNLLTAMLSNVALLQLGDSLNHEIVYELERAVEKASGICQQMLAYAGKGQFEMKPLRLATLVRDMRKLLEVSVDKSIQLAFHLDHSSPAVFGDESQLSQVVLNLAINAAESIDCTEGKVVISVKKESVEAFKRSEGFRISPSELVDDYICLTVEDNGIGIEEDKVPKVFDPFYTSKFTGRGMGLAAVRGILSGHNAGLTVRSGPGSGTAFRVWLPVTSEKAQDAPRVTLQGTIGEEVASKSILVVDDEAQVRLALTRILEHYGFAVTAASDGIDGLEKFQNHGEHDLVLLDLTMPGMSGVETFKQLRQQASNARVLIMSGYEEQELSSRFAAERPEGFIKKPFRLSHLVERVQELLRS